MQSWEKAGATRDNFILWAASTLCFFGFLRSRKIVVPSKTASDEGAHLTFEDVMVSCISNPQMHKVRIKASKTDPFRLGVEILWARQVTRCAQSQQY